MYLIVALCLLCSWVAPHACRSVDPRDPPSEDLAPFVAHHHHEGNIAELLIPLLERSLAQSEARSNERQHRRAKAGKKVIQVLPYRGSEEHKRKGWRKLNSHKKQVVEITPLHGKNRAKPLAYILSAAKPSQLHTEKNEDFSSSNTSELEHDKSTSEEQQSSEENRENSEDVNVNTLRTANVDPSSASSNVQSSEDAYSKESKDSSASEKESADVTAESDVTAEKSEERKVVVVEESEEDEVQLKSGKHVHTNHHHKSKATVDVVTAEEEGVTAEDVEVTAEDAGVTAEDVTATAEDREATAEEVSVTAEDTAVTSEADVTAEAADVTPENKSVTAEDLDVTAENTEITAENKAVTLEDVEVTVEDRALTVEDVEVTAEDKAVTAEEQVTLEDNVTSEDKAVTSENDAVTAEDQLAVEDDVTAERRAVTAEVNADVTSENVEVTAEENVTGERAVTAEDIEEVPKRGLKHAHPHQNDVSDINRILDTIGRGVTAENEDSNEPSRGGYIENDIVISRGHHQSDSEEKSISRLFNAKARDIIELIQSSVEASTAAHKDCLEPSQKHDHKSYRLSFLFNK